MTGWEKTWRWYNNKKMDMWSLIVWHDDGCERLFYLAHICIYKILYDMKVWKDLGRLKNFFCVNIYFSKLFHSICFSLLIFTEMFSRYFSLNVRTILKYFYLILWNHESHQSFLFVKINFTIQCSSFLHLKGEIDN